ncbi:hypothetical protein AB0F91_38465 [Amycolatopsis sp. NPDC023774]|uniref:hypothetical protein n=1 Tax=Amycolatopsis sp. NPDC023774 TaxID=3155015 RepID=UPI0033FEE3F1
MDRVAWLAVLPAGCTGLLPASAAAEALLIHGARTDGEVTDVSDRVVAVDHALADVSSRAEIDRLSGHRYTAGEIMPVFYDPANPHTARLRDDVNLSRRG